MLSKRQINNIVGSTWSNYLQLSDYFEGDFELTKRNYIHTSTTIAATTTATTTTTTTTTTSTKAKDITVTFSQKVEVEFGLNQSALSVCNKLCQKGVTVGS